MKNLFKQIGSFTFMALFAMLLASCPEIPIDEKDNNAELESLSIAGRRVNFGEPVENMSDPAVVEITLSYEDASDASIEITISESTGIATYGKMQPGDDIITWETGNMDFSSGDVLIIKVESEGGAVRYYKITIQVEEIVLGIASISIAGKTVDFGNPSDDLETADAAEITLSFEEAANTAIVINLKSDKASAEYGIIEDGSVDWAGSGPLDFTDGDILAIKVEEENDSFSYYKLIIKVLEEPDNNAEMESLHIGEKEITFGNSSAELATATAAPVSFLLAEASNVAIVIITSSENATAMYSKVGSNNAVTWRDSGNLSFTNGEVLGIRIRAGSGIFRYYKFSITVISPPDNNAEMEALFVGGKRITFGYSVDELETAPVLSASLTSKEASNGIVVIIPKSHKAKSRMYGKMNGENVTWASSGALNFNVGDVLAIRIESESGLFRYHKFLIDEIHIPLPPPSSAEDFRQRYMNFLTEIPVMRISTEGNREVTSKETYINATINIEGSAEYNVSDWEVEIRGRGNSTWNEMTYFDGRQKKPYRIKALEKRSIFGLPEVRSWALCAEYADKSLMRNYTVHMLDRSLGTMVFSSNVIYVEVYFNNRYDGLYILKDHIKEVRKNTRVDVEGFILDANGNLAETAFMIEVDWVGGTPPRNPNAVQNRDYFRAGGVNWFIHYPRFDDDGFEGNSALHTQAVNQIRTYVENVHSAIQNNYSNFNNLCERETFVDYYIVQELVKNVDGNKLSIYANKKLGQKMQMGPLWDFDITLGNCYFPQWRTPDYSPDTWGIGNSDGELNWNRRLMQNNDFRDAVRTRYMGLHTREIAYVIDSIDIVKEFIRPAANRNFDWFRVMGKWIWCNPPEVEEADTFDKQVDYLKDWLQTRTNWLNGRFDARQWP